MTPPAAAAAESLPRRGRSTRPAPVRHPRRVSGPAAPARTSQPRRNRQARTTSQPQARGLALRGLDAYQRVADNTLLDRLVRGRLWIGLLAFGLIGIVAMQLMVLKLNTGIGAKLERAADLQRANAQLRIEAATGSGEGRVEPLAAATGMTFAPSGSVHFVSSSPATDITRAAQALSHPIQPRESAPATGSQEASAGAGEGEANTAAASAGASETGASEPVSESAEASSAGSAEVGAAAESHGSEAAPASAGEPEASASAAGGVAAGG